MSNRDHLGGFEQIVLLALIRLQSNAYGMTIRREIAERTKRDVSIGAVYTTLDRLERKGYVKSHKGEAIPERGGRAKRFFEVTGLGVKALNESRQTMERMWQGVEPVGV